MSSNFYVCKSCRKKVAGRRPCATLEELDKLCLSCWREERYGKEKIEIIHASPRELQDGSLWQDYSKVELERDQLRTMLAASEKIRGELLKEANSLANLIRGTEAFLTAECILHESCGLLTKFRQRIEQFENLKAAHRKDQS